MFRNSKVSVDLIKFNGIKETVIIYEWKRGENQFYYKRTDGSWITPFEFKHRYKYAEGFGGLNTLFKVIYQEHLENLIPTSNPLLKKVKWEGSVFHQPIILKKGEHY